MPKHRIALLGCGGMAQTHVSRLEPVFDRLEVTAVVDLDRARAEAVAGLLPNHPAVFTDYREAFPCCDAVLQVLPHHLHAEVTVDCLNAGKHVLAEKPLANTEQECLAMIEAAKRNKRVLMTAYCMRFHPLLVEMYRLIREKVYGNCFQLSIWTEQFTKREEGSWLRSEKLLGGGQLFSHGCHYIDLMLWMLGKPVYGFHCGSNFCTPWMEREGTSNVTIRFENGAMGYHFGTWGARGSRLRYSFHAHCEQGMLEADISGGKLYLHNELKPHQPGEMEEQRLTVLKEAPWAKPTTEEMIHFLNCIENGTVPLTSPEDSLQGLRVIWALYKAEDKCQAADLRGLGLNR